MGFGLGMMRVTGLLQDTFQGQLFPMKVALERVCILPILPRIRFFVDIESSHSDMILDQQWCFGGSGRSDSKSHKFRPDTVGLAT